MYLWAQSSPLCTYIYVSIYIAFHIHRRTCTQRYECVYLVKSMHTSSHSCRIHLYVGLLRGTSPVREAAVRPFSIGPHGVGQEVVFNASRMRSC